MNSSRTSSPSLPPRAPSPQSAPQPDPPSADIPSSSFFSPSFVKAQDTNEFFLETTIGYYSCDIAIRGSPIASEHGVYQMFHDQLTLDGLYRFGRENSCWWRVLDWLRDCWPAWFLPHRFVLKDYDLEHDMRPDFRINFEFNAYKKLIPIQGRGVPRCYGLAIFQNRLILLLQYIDGITLDQHFYTSTDAEDTNASIIRNVWDVVSMLTLHGVLADMNGSNIIVNEGNATIIDFDLAQPETSDSIENQNKQGFANILKQFEKKMN